MEMKPLSGTNIPQMNSYAAAKTANNNFRLKVSEPIDGENLHF